MCFELRYWGRSEAHTEGSIVQKRALAQSFFLMLLFYSVAPYTPIQLIEGKRHCVTTVYGVA
jgi:hypothetical protein